MSNRILVTGGAGFIGSNLCEQLLKKGHSVVTIDNLRTGKEENVPAGVEFFNQDLGKPSSLSVLNNRKFDVIIHLAGQSSGEISFEDPVYDINANTVSTINLIEYARKTNVKHFIYASSMSVYGGQTVEQVSENSPCYPLSYYGVGKLSSEKYLDVVSGTYKLNTTALRFFNVYGPHQNLSNLKQGMVSIYLAQLLTYQKILVKGSLNRFRDFIFIDDVVEAIIHTIENEKTYSQRINVGTGSKTTVRDLIDSMFSAIGKKVEVVEAEGTLGDQNGIYADVTLMNNLIGYKAQISLKEGMARMVKWAMENGNSK
ncbi:NAD-dependent epimerase/dehydratase family protein [Leptospira biflexa]|uniref:NAD-dependent epimerase/dehydratase family protein n=1 Tax=Leptospira biflexa TaxID=172 RepID=UPI0010830AAE|nr:NAD-dependent epimerase/dehydratase family protein [Leptospira biflexa]TGM31731.1 NAD-dependent epimerase/dehydratase family protein [Leptospira biflexa]TGM39110.1 NAD-dependent epimerase/dehydratase family protein [Leptospira biflexa]